MKNAPAADNARPPAKPKAATDVPLEQRFGVRMLHLADRLLARVWHHTIVLKREHLPKTGPAILVCNHTSGLDPFIVQSVLDRVIIWMMAEEYYTIKGLTWIFKMIEAIPVDRAGRDSTSVRLALRSLKAGRILGIFPEGRIATSNDLLPFQTGVALMAIKTGVPVYPAFLDGTQRGKSMIAGFIWPNRATLAFGPPVEFDRSDTSKEVLEAATDKIRDAVEALRGTHARR